MQWLFFGHPKHALLDLYQKLRGPVHTPNILFFHNIMNNASYVWFRIIPINRILELQHLGKPLMGFKDFIVIAPCAGTTRIIDVQLCSCVGLPNMMSHETRIPLPQTGHFLLRWRDDSGLQVHFR